MWAYDLKAIQITKDQSKQLWLQYYKNWSKGSALKISEFLHTPLKKLSGSIRNFLTRPDIKKTIFTSEDINPIFSEADHNTKKMFLAMRAVLACFKSRIPKPPSDFSSVIMLQATKWVPLWLLLLDQKKSLANLVSLSKIRSEIG